MARKNEPEPIRYAVELQHGTPCLLLKKPCDNAQVLDTALHFAQQYSRKHYGLMVLVYEYEARSKTLRAMAYNGASYWPKDCDKCHGFGRDIDGFGVYITCQYCYGLGKVAE